MNKLIPHILFSIHHSAESDSSSVLHFLWCWLAACLPLGPTKHRFADCDSSKRSRNRVRRFGLPPPPHFTINPGFFPGSFPVRRSNLQQIKARQGETNIFKQFKIINNVVMLILLHFYFVYPYFCFLWVIRIVAPLQHSVLIHSQRRHECECAA